MSNPSRDSTSVSAARPAATTGSRLAIVAPLAARSARHFSSRPGAAGEFRARASRATSQIGRGGPDGPHGPSPFTLPIALTAPPLRALLVLPGVSEFPRLARGHLCARPADPTSPTQPPA